MPVNYAEKYSPIVDERFKLGPITAGFTNGEYDWIGVESVKVYSIPVAEMNNYTLTGSNRYGSPAELENMVQEMKVTQDRSFTFTIDRKSHDDTMMVMEAGRALRRQIDEVCIPEIDKYRLAAFVAGCKSAHVHNSADPSASNAYALFLACQEDLDNAKVPQGGRLPGVQGIRFAGRPGGAEQCQVLRPEAPGLRSPPRSDIQGSGSLHQRPNGAIPGTHRQFQAAIISVLSSN